MNIELQRISIDEKPILRNLMQLCFHDYSEFNNEDVGQFGLYDYKYLDHYWTEPERFAYFVKIDGKLAGFAIGMHNWLENGRHINILSEFFILRKYRRKGIGIKVAHQIFDEFPGRWSVGQETDNYPAQAFWRKVIDAYTNGDFTEIQWEKGPAQEFESPVQ